MADTLSVRQQRQEADVVFSSTSFDGTREVSGYLLDYEGNIGVVVSGGSPASAGGGGGNAQSSFTSFSTSAFRSSTGSNRSNTASGGGPSSSSSSGFQKYAEFFAQQADVDVRQLMATHSYTGTLLKDAESGSWVPHGKGKLVYRVWKKNKNSQKATVAPGSPKENAPPQGKVDTVSPTKRSSDAIDGAPHTANDSAKPQETTTVFECIFEGKFVNGRRQGEGMLVIPKQYVLFCQWNNDSPSIETKPCVLLFLSATPTETSMAVVNTTGKGSNSTSITVALPPSAPGVTRSRFGSRLHNEGTDARERSSSGADPTRATEDVREDKVYIGDQYVGMVSLITHGMTTRADFDGLAWVSQVQILPDCTGEMLFHNDKKRYCGGWQCGQRHGFGVELDPKTDTVFMGAFQYDVRDGPGTLYSDNYGTVFSGVWKDGDLTDTANLYLPNSVATIQGAHWKSYDTLDFENGAVLRTRGTLNGIWEPMFIDFDNILAVSALETRDVDNMSYGDLVSNMLQKPQLMSVLAQFQRCFYFQYSLCPVRGKTVRARKGKSRQRGGEEEERRAYQYQQHSGRDGQRSQAIPLNAAPLDGASRSRHSRPAFLSAPEPSITNTSLGSDPCIHGTSASSRTHVRSADEHGLIATPTIRSRALPPNQQSSTPLSNHSHQLLPLAMRREQARQQKRSQQRGTSDRTPGKGASAAAASSEGPCGMGSDDSDSSDDDSENDNGSGDPTNATARKSVYVSPDGRLRPQPSAAHCCKTDGFDAVLRRLANQGNATVCQRREWVSPSWCEEMGLGMHCFHAQLSAWRPTLCLTPPPGVHHLLLRRERTMTHSTFSSAMHCLASFVASVRLRLLSFVAAHPSACDLSVSKDVLRVCWDCLYALVSPVLFDLSKTLEPYQESEFALAVRRLRRVTLHDFIADAPQWLEMTPNGWYHATNVAEKRNFGKRQYTTQRVVKVLAERWAQVFSSILSCADLERTVEHTAWGPLVLLHTRTKCESPMDAVRVLLATYQVAMCISPSNALLRERVFTYCAVAAFQHVESKAAAIASRVGCGSRYRVYDPVSVYSPVAQLRILDLLARDVTPGYPFDVVKSFHDESFEKDIINSIATAPSADDHYSNSPLNSRNDGEEEDWRSGEDMDEEMQESEDHAVGSADQRWISPGGKRRPVSLRSNSTDSSRNDIAVSNLVQMALEGVRRASKLFANIRDVYTGTLYPLDEISLRVQYIFLEAFHTSDVEADFIVASPDAIASLAVPTRLYVQGDIPGCTPNPSPSSTPNMRAVMDASAALHAVQYLLSISDVLQPCDVMIASLQRRSGDNVENALTARIVWVIASIGEVFTMPEEFSTSTSQGVQSSAAAAAIVAAASPPSPRGAPSQGKSSPRYRGGGTAVTAHANRVETENDCDFEFQWKHFVYLAQPVRRASADAVNSLAASPRTNTTTAAGAAHSTGATREFPSTATATTTVPNPISPREQMQFVLLKALLMRLGVSVCLQARYCNADEDEDEDESMEDEDTPEAAHETETPDMEAKTAARQSTAPTNPQEDATKTPLWKSLWVSSSDSSSSDSGGNEGSGENDGSGRLKHGNASRAQTHKSGKSLRRKNANSRSGPRSAHREEYNGMETTLMLRCRRSFLRSAVREALASEWGSCRRALQQTIQMNSQRIGARKTR